MTSQTQPIDATINVITPENIAFNYRVAGPFRRLLAFLIDFGIRASVFTVISIVITIVGSAMSFSPLGTDAVEVAIGVLILIWYVSQWFYGALFETYWNGQTPGKWLLGIRVVAVEGEPINGMQAVLRNLVRWIDCWPFWSMVIPVGMVGLVAMMMNKRFQRLGDMVAGTMVVIEERSWLLGVAKLEDPRAAQLAAYLPPKFEVSRSLGRALATYVERRKFFSQARRREIARHLAEPLLREFGLPADTSYDLLLCAVYYKAFVAESGDEENRGPSPFGGEAQPTPPVYVPPPLPQEQIAGMPRS